METHWIEPTLFNIFWLSLIGVVGNGLIFGINLYRKLHGMPLGIFGPKGFDAYKNGLVCFGLHGLSFLLSLATMIFSIVGMSLGW